MKTQFLIKKHVGFTLAEVFFSLVFFGLIIGSFMRTHVVLIEAKVRFLQDKIGSVERAWLTFVERYQAVPGDYLYAKVNIDSSLLPGNGDGLINQSQERGQVWSHMIASGFFENKHLDGASIYEQEYDCSLRSCPHNTFGYGINVSYGNEGQSNDEAANELILGKGIPAQILLHLDQSIDDGKADQGKLQLGNGGRGWDNTLTQMCLQSEGLYAGKAIKNCAAVLRVFE